MEKLCNKKVLVTGSTRGIGFAIAREFAKNNATIALNGLASIEEIKTICNELSSLTSGNVFFYEADLSKVDHITQMMERAHTEMKGIDILVNNAGIQHVASIETFPVDQWQKIIDINLSAAFHTTRLALPHMQQQHFGRIINVASAHGLVGSIHKSAYVAAKHGLVGFTKVVALENAPLGITCNALCPGWVLTPLVEKQIQQRMMEQSLSYETAAHDLLFEKQPSLTFVNPSDIGSYAVFLSSAAGASITGAALTIDGGWTAR